MNKKTFSVSELANLCCVHRETICRWRLQGVRGIHLEATVDQPETQSPYGVFGKLNGQSLYFTTDSVHSFYKRTGKAMPPALKQALGESSTPQPAKVTEMPVTSNDTAAAAAAAIGKIMGDLAVGLLTQEGAIQCLANQRDLHRKNVEAETAKVNMYDRVLKALNKK